MKIFTGVEMDAFSVNPRDVLSYSSVKTTSTIFSLLES